MSHHPRSFSRVQFILTMFGVACAAAIADGTFAPIAFAQNVPSQSASVQSNQQLALSTPTAIGGTQMLRSDASVLYNSGQYVTAAEIYRRLIQLGSLDASDRYWLGECLYHTGNFPQAITAFEQSVQINQKLEQAYVRLAETYLALHMKDKAFQVCTGGLRIVTDAYMKEQLSNLSKVALHQEAKPSRSRQIRSSRLPSES